VSGPCWATVMRWRPRHDPTVVSGQHEARTPPCRAVLGSCFFESFSGQPIGPGSSGHLYRRQGQTLVKQVNAEC
jgi:hypothetical protein